MNDSPLSIVFPGQGVQRPGMGRDFIAAEPVARQAFEEASDATGLDIEALCCGTDDRLSLTEFAQPAILTTEIAMFRVARDRLGLQTGACFFAGHSLGEFSALVAADALPLGKTAALVRERGRLMQAAVPADTGGMTAVIGADLNIAKLEQLLANTGVVIANDNSAEQVVLSGLLPALADVGNELQQAVLAGNVGKCRLVPLPVSAPFHSPLMREIEPAFASCLDELKPSLNADAAVRVVSNVNGGFHTADRDWILGALTAQISGTVRWRDNMATLRAAAPTVLEIGPGKPLRGFFKTIGVTAQSVTSFKSLERLAITWQDKPGAQAI